MERPGLLDLVRSSIEDVIVHGELFQPRFYAFLASVVFGLGVILSIGASTAMANPLLDAVGVVILFLAGVVVFCVFLLSDMWVVEMVRDSKRAGINKAACFKRAKGRLWTYVLSAIPVGMAGLLLSALLEMVLLPMVPAAAAEPYASAAVQVVSVLVSLLLSVFFVFLAQTVVFEAKGVMDTLRMCVARASSSFFLLLKYVVFRGFLSGMVDLLLALPLVFFLFKLGYPVPDLEGLDAWSALIIASLVLVYSGLKMVVLDSFLVVMDTHAYSAYMPAMKPKARKK